MNEIKKEDIKNLHYTHTNEVQFEYGGRTYHYSMEGLKDLLVTCWNCYSQLEQKEKQLNDIKEYVKELSDNTDDTTCYEIDRHTKQELMLFLIEDKIDDLYNKIIERNSSD